MPYIKFSRTLVAAFVSVGLAAPAQASCEAFMAESQAVSGAVPRLDENGKLQAIVVYGEGVFLAPKRSLINKARSVAEMAAKRAFVEWIDQENFSAEEEARSMLETVEVTNQDGETAGVAQEISTYVEAMRSNSGATINALAKLDECVDPEEKVVIVELGWKPEFSSAAKSASAVLPGAEQSASGGETEATDSSKLSGTDGPSSITPSVGYRIKSKLKDDF
jgi:hypothetical protein